MTLVATSGKISAFAAAPSGQLHYHDIEGIVEALVFTEGRRVPIPGMAFEDLAQEIRLECLRVLPTYERQKSPVPYKYLQVCVRNRLFNMRRGVYVPNNPPCARCSLWDKEFKLCKISEVGCRDIVDYRRSMDKKASLRSPSALNEDASSADIRSVLELEARILDEDIRSQLPRELLPDYIRIISGHGRNVSQRQKRRIRDFVQKMLDDA